MEGLAILVIAAVAAAFSLVSGRLKAWPITGPMIFVGVGALLSAHSFNVLHLDVEPNVMHFLAEFTLIFLLFADASKINIKPLRRGASLPVRLLGIGMPLTILAGVGLGLAIFPEWPMANIVILAVVLTPTDAALGQAIVEDERLPAGLRQGLGVESGLNDGITVSVVMIAIAVASAGASTGTDDTPGAMFAIMQVTLGPLVGGVVGAAGGKAMEWAESRGAIESSYQAIGGLALAVVAYALAEAVGGNGFIAAFVGGLAIGNVAPKACTRFHRFVEDEGQLLMFLVFLLVGVLYSVEIIQTASLRSVLFAVGALTIMRIVPVIISLTGSGMHWLSKIFAGWFGPRGIASIVFAIVVLESHAVEMREEIFSITLLTVLMSVFAHGVTAVPAASFYAKFCAPNLPADAPEHTTADSVSRTIRR